MKLKIHKNHHTSWTMWSKYSKFSQIYFYSLGMQLQKNYHCYWGISEFLISDSRIQWTEWFDDTSSPNWFLGNINIFLLIFRNLSQNITVLFSFFWFSNLTFAKLVNVHSIIIQKFSNTVESSCIWFLKEVWGFNWLYMPVPLTSIYLKILNIFLFYSCISGYILLNFQHVSSFG